MPATRGLVTGWLSAVVGRSRSIQQAADAGDAIAIMENIAPNTDAATIRPSLPCFGFLKIDNGINP